MSEIKNYIAVSQVDGGNASLTYLSQKPILHGDGTNEIGITTEVKHVELQTYQVKSTMSSEQEQDLAAIGIDAAGMLRSALENEAIQGQDKQIYKKMKLLGYESNRKLWTKIQTIANKWVEYVPMTDISKKGSLLKRINLLRNQIATTARTGRANFVIISPGLLQYFIEDDGFKVSEHDSSTQVGLVYKCGTYRDELDVLVNPSISWTDKRVVIGRSTTSMGEGIFLVEHSEGDVFDRSERVNSASLTPEVETILRNRYALVHTENAAKNYITITCTEKKHNIFTHIIAKYFKKKK
jgi:hypothetical protein